MARPLQTFEEIGSEIETLKVFKAEAEAKIKKAETDADAAKKEAEALKKKMAEGETRCAECGSTSHSTSQHGEAETKKGSKFPKTMRAMKAAAEAKDEAEASRHMGEAMKHYKSESEEEEKEEKEAEARRAEAKKGMGPETLKEQKEEHQALKAELTVLRGELAKPRMAALTASYKGKVTEEKLKEYQAAWKEMSIAQLDDQIAQVEMFVGKISPQTPFGFSTFDMPYSASTENTKDEFMANIDKKTAAELFA